MRFVEDTNHFLEQKNLHTLFDMANQELLVNDWFISNRNFIKCWENYYFPLAKQKNDIPLMLPMLQINSQLRVASFRFLGVSLDQCLLWKRHIKYIENKVTTNISLLYKTKRFVKQSSMLIFPVGIYLLKVNNRNTRIRYEICSKLTKWSYDREGDINIFSFWDFYLFE